jgi:hypothetical protein
MKRRSLALAGAGRAVPGGRRNLRGVAMRFLVVGKANQDSEAGILPSKKLIIEMGMCNGELARAGAMLAAEGLQPTAKGARVKFENSWRAVIRGPFPDPGSLAAGYWSWRVNSLDDAISRIRHVPLRDTGFEIRQVFETEFAPSDPTGELRRQEERLRSKISGRS